jgi:Xaa-Pro aminopeptidase
MTEVSAHLLDMPAMDVPGRLSRLRAAMGGHGPEALLVSNLVNIRYLSGFSGSAALLLVRPDDAVLVTDGRYATQARAELERAGVAARVEVRPAHQQGEVLGELARGLARLGLEGEHVSWGLQRRFSQSWASDIELVATKDLVEQLRQGKDAGELARVAAAARTADHALQNVRGMLDAGRSECDFALALDTEMRRLGAAGPAFETIVAAGPNGAEPHHHPSPRPVGRGELVVVDFGAVVDGYCSDMTRSLWAGPGPGPGAGRGPAELARAYSVVLAAQEAGLAAVADGAAAAEVDRACREVVGAAGMGEYFVHGTGHGVGLDIHEAPWVGAASEDILCSGQVVTVEPGVYIPGLGGARIEDTVVVTGSGCEVLTLTPKQA